jgi:peptide/nickel transport system permease protein
MLNFFVKRLGYGFLVILGVAIVVFLIFHAMPGDPIDLMVGPRTDKATKEAIRHELQLDQPLLTQLYLYLSDLSPLALHPDTPEAAQKYDYFRLFGFSDQQAVVLKQPYLRRSFQTNKLVSEILVESLPGTLWLAFAAMLFATVSGIFLGTLAAFNRDGVIDRLVVGLSVLGISTPSFVAALLVAMIFGYYLSEYTGLPITGSLWENDPIYGRRLQLQNLVLPAFTLGIRPLAIITQLMRGSLIEVMQQDYIRTAMAKGVGKMRLLFRHAMRNALSPVVTAVSGWLASLMAGSFFIEYIFNWKGLGLKTIQAVDYKDFPVVMGSVMLVALLFVLVNLLVDLLYAWINPAVRLS